jgi:hypothetical protein
MNASPPKNDLHIRGAGIVGGEVYLPLTRKPILIPIDFRSCIRALLSYRPPQSGGGRLLWLLRSRHKFEPQRTQSRDRQRQSRKSMLSMVESCSDVSLFCSFWKDCDLRHP